MSLSPAPDSLEFSENEAGRSPKKVKRPLPTWVKILLVTGGISLLGIAALFLGVYSWLTPVMDQFFKPQSAATVQQKIKDYLVIPKGAPYKVKQAIDVLGVKVVRLEHTQQPQEFVLIQGLDSQTMDDLFRDDLDPKLLETMGQSFLKMRGSGAAESLTVEKLETVEKNTLQVNGQAMPYKHMKIIFQLSSEPAPRVYEGTLGRLPGAPGQETLLVSFAKAGVYHPDRVLTFLKTVSLKSPS